MLFPKGSDAIHPEDAVFTKTFDWDPNDPYKRLLLTVFVGQGCQNREKPKPDTVKRWICVKQDLRRVGAVDFVWQYIVTRCLKGKIY
jgi:hypothetical protein